MREVQAQERPAQRRNTVACPLGTHIFNPPVRGFADSGLPFFVAEVPSVRHGEILLAIGKLGSFAKGKARVLKHRFSDVTCAPFLVIVNPPLVVSGGLHPYIYIYTYTYIYIYI